MTKIEIPSARISSGGAVSDTKEKCKHPTEYLEKTKSKEGFFYVERTLCGVCGFKLGESRF